MPENPKRIIRQAVVDALVVQTGGEYPTNAGARVFNNRDVSLGENSPDTIIVRTGDEELDRDHMHQDGVRRRTLALSVEAYSLGEEGADRTDDIAWQVENALRGDPTLGGLVERIELVRTSANMADDGVTSLHVTDSAFEVIYWTHETQEEGAPPTIVMLGFDPDTGPGNEPDYTTVTGEELP